MRILALALCVCSLSGQTIVNVTSKQAVVKFTAPDTNPCSYTLSPSDPVNFKTLGSGSRTRYVVIGDSFTALAVNTQYTLTICGTQTVKFITQGLAMGGAPKVPPFSASTYNKYGWPKILDSPSVVDPSTGLRLSAVGIGFYKRYYDSTNLANFAISGGVLYPFMPHPGLQVGLGLYEVQVTYNCASGTRTLQLGTSLTTFGDPVVVTCTGSPATYPASIPNNAILSSWGNARIPRELQFPIQANVNSTGSTVANSNVLGFANLNWFFPRLEGEKISLTSTLYDVTSVVNGNTLIVSGTPGSGTLISKALGVRVTGGTLTNLDVRIFYERTPKYLADNGGSAECSDDNVTITVDSAGSPAPARVAKLCLVRKDTDYTGALLFEDNTELRPVFQLTSPYSGDTITSFASGIPVMTTKPWVSASTLIFEGNSLTEKVLISATYRGNGAAYYAPPMLWDRATQSDTGLLSTNCFIGEFKVGNVCLKMITDPSLGQSPRQRALASGNTFLSASSPFMTSGLRLVGLKLPYVIYRAQPIQDARAYYMVLNLNTTNIHSIFDSDYGVDHTSQSWWNGYKYAIQMNPPGSRGNVGGMSGPYTVTTSTTLPNNSLTITINVNSLYPCAASSVANERAFLPCPWDALRTGIRAITVGTFLSSPTNLFDEVMQVEAVGTNTLTLRRGVNNSTIRQWNVGESLAIYPNGACATLNTGMNWYDIENPAAPVEYGDCNISSNHLDQTGGWVTNTLYSANVGTVINTPLRFTGSFSDWYGNKCDNSFCPGPSRIEEYPSLNPSEGSAITTRALNGGAGSNYEAGTQVNSVTITSVATDVYKIVVPGFRFDKGFHPVGWAGGMLLKNLSSPTKIMSSADSPGFCLVEVAGECFAGSVRWEVYVSLKNAHVTSFCWTNLITPLTPCVLPSSPLMNTVVKQNLNAQEYHTPLTQALLGPSRFITYSTNRMFGPHLMVQIPTADGVYPILAVGRPGALSSRNHGKTYAPVMVNVPANSYILFGYNENLECTERAEKCAVNSSTLNLTNPWWWAVRDTFSATSVPQQILIPREPDRLIFYQVVTNGIPGGIEVI